MRKQHLLTSLLLAVLLFFNVACGDKDSSNDSTSGSDTSTSSEPTSGGEVPQAPDVDVNLDKSAVDALLDKLKKSNPEMQLDRVTKVDKAPIPGFYQLMADGDVFYVSANGEVMVVGDVISLDSKANLTEEVRKTARLELLNSIPESEMVVYTPDNGKYDYTVTVFTDTTCGYCRKFHRELKDYLANGIKVRYMAFPRAGKGSDSYNQAATIWCSDNPQEAMNSAKLNDDFKAADKLCNKTNAIDKQMELVRKLGLRGTPALVFETGELWPGYMPADRLKLVLDSKVNKNSSLSSTSNGSAG